MVSRTVGGMSQTPDWVGRGTVVLVLGGVEEVEVWVTVTVVVRVTVLT